MAKRKISVRQMIDGISEELFVFLKQLLQSLDGDDAKDEKLVLYAMERFIARTILDLEIDPQISYEHLVVMVKQIVNENLRQQSVSSERVGDRYTVH